MPLKKGRKYEPRSRRHHGSLGGSEIGVVLPASANHIDTHYWNGTYWNSSDYGFVGFWSIVNTAPASLPVAITNPVRVSEGNAAQTASSTASADFVLATVPNGKKWKLLGCYMSGINNNAGLVTLAMSIQRNGITSDILDPTPITGSEMLLWFSTSTADTNTEYTAYANTASLSTPLPSGSPGNVNATHWSDYPILYAGDKIYAANDLQSTNYSAIYYVESDI